MDHPVHRKSELSPAGLLARGSAGACLSGPRSSDVCWRSLAAYSCGYSRRLAPAGSTAFPVTSVRRTVDERCLVVRGDFVNVEDVLDGKEQTGRGAVRQELAGRIDQPTLRGGDTRADIDHL